MRFRPSVRMLVAGILVLACMTASPRSAFAHHRDFTLSRDWFLPYKGEMEVETRTSWVHKTGEILQEFEFEYGVNDHFAIEPGIEFHRDPGGNLEFDGNDIELRFNFGNFKPNKLMTALNVEFEKPKDDVWHGELKFIFSVYGRDGSDASMNVNVGRGLGSDGDVEGELTFGYMRPLGKGHQAEVEEGGYNLGLRGGLEAMWDFNEHNILLGPTLVYRANKHFNILGTLAFGLNHGDDNPGLFRLISEYEF